MELDYTFKEIANLYFNLGLNITFIDGNEEKTNGEDSFKSPVNQKWKYFTLKKQDNLERWWAEFGKPTGIGTVLGPHLRCIDIDGCTDIEFITDILSILGLPPNYEWVVKTGSQKGFHILFICETHNFPVAYGKVKAFVSNGFKEFERLELRWFGHLVLPSSIHSSGHIYEFLNDNYPKKKPLSVDENNIDKVVNKYCSDNNLAGSSGLFLDHGPSYLSKEISLINDDLTLFYDSSIKMIFAFKTNDVDDFIQGISWVLLDGNNKIIEYCNYFVEAENFDSLYRRWGYYDLYQENNIAELNEVGVQAENVLIAFKNRFEIVDKCFALEDNHNYSGQDMIMLQINNMNLTTHDNIKSKIKFYYNGFSLGFNKRLFDKLGSLEELESDNKLPSNLLSYRNESFLKPVFDKIISAIKLSV